MANNTTINPGSGGDVISDDQITTLNGAGIATGEKTQRIKIAYGAPASATDVSTTNGLPIQGITAGATTVAWTSGTALNTASSISISGMNAVSVSLIPTTTFSGGILSFEVSPDNTNWVPIAMARVDSYTSETTYTIVASTNRGWTTSVDGFTNFRVRLSTAITGTGTATVIIIPQAFAIEPMVTVGQAAAANLSATTFAQPTTTGGLTTYTLISAATTNATSVKASAGQVYGIQASNTGAAAAFLKLYNKASAPTVGTDAAVKTLIIPAGGGIVVSAADLGMVFGTGIALAITGVATTADTTAVALSQVVVNLDYK